MWLSSSLDVVTSKTGRETESCFRDLAPHALHPPTTTHPGVLPHRNPCWVPAVVQLLTCGCFCPMPCLLPSYSCSVTEKTGRKRRDRSGQPLPGRTWELGEQFEGQPNTERRAWQLADRTAFLSMPRLGPSGPESDHRPSPGAPI